jgi:hypothetical protein
MSLTVLQPALHVQTLSSGYKRSLSSVEFQPSKQSRVPGLDAPSAPFSAKPHSQTNVCVPVARVCLPSLQPGTIAFIHRCVGLRTSAGESAASQMNSHVLGIDALNAILAESQNRVTFNNQPLDAFFEIRKAKSHFAPAMNGNGVVYSKARVCKPLIDLVGSHMHPLIQYALDGIVSTAPEADTQGISAAHGVGSSSAICNVAVAGHCIMQSKVVVKDPLKAIQMVAYPNKFVVPDNFHIEPIEILAKLYVVLVCVRETATSKDWTFRYEVVSSSNMAAAYPKKGSFLDGLGNVKDAKTIRLSTKIVLKAFELGKIVDTNFVNPQKQIVVCICMRPYEETEKAKREVTKKGKKTTIAFVKPLDVFKTFNAFRTLPAKKDRVLLTKKTVGRPTMNQLRKARMTPVGEWLDSDEEVDMNDPVSV